MSGLIFGSSFWFIGKRNAPGSVYENVWDKLKKMSLDFKIYLCFEFLEAREPNENSTFLSEFSEGTDIIRVSSILYILY